MQLVDLTLPTPQENLALDEALLDWAEQADAPCEALRLWESPAPVVVVGRSSRVELEVNLPACHAAGIPVLRRASGGAAIVAGRGSLMYALLLRYDLRTALRSLDEAHRFVLGTLLSAVETLVPGVARQGISDLTWGDRKFSGNSVRCKRRAFLYHGTLLYGFDLPLIEHCLRTPARQPVYRKNRAHQAFLTNLPTDGARLRAAVIGAWGAHEAMSDWPRDRVRRLVDQRYSQQAWNYQL